jgi:hypothetical protein
MLKKTLGTILAAALMLSFSAPARTQSLNGSAGQMPAYYDAKLFTINFKQLPPGGEGSVLTQNKSINLIYMSDQAVMMGFDFISVLNAIQGDGFNPLWNEVQITFASGTKPFQLFSDDQITAAAKAGTISLRFTTEVYRCSVVGPK